MNVSQLKAFVMVVEHESFSEAARAMGISQPAVTMQVQALESAVGATLLERRYRAVGLTEAGRALLPHARTVLAELELARQELEALSETVTGRVAIAASTTPGQYVLPRLLGGFVAEHPDVGVAVEVMDTSAVIDAVAAGDAQMGVTGAEVAGTKVVFEPWGTDELVVVCAPADELAGRSNVPLSVLAEHPFIMREAGSGTRIVAEGVLHAGGVDPADLNVVMELGTNEAVVSAVEGGMGVGIVSRWVADKALSLRTVAEVDAEGFPHSRPLFIATGRIGASRATEALLEYLRSHEG